MGRGRWNEGIDGDRPARDRRNRMIEDGSVKGLEALMGV